MTQVTLNNGSVDSAGSLKLRTNGTTDALILDAAQNVGVGVTPSAWYSSATAKALQIPSGALSSDNVNDLFLTQNAYLNSGATAWVRTNAGYATQYTQTTGQHQWYTAASSTQGSNISFTQAMTLDASGRLGVGVTSPAAVLDLTSGSNGRLQISPGGGIVAVSFVGNNGSGYSSAIYNGTQHIFQYSGTEAARIDTSGNLLVGTTSAPRFGKFVVSVNPAINNTFDSVVTGTGGATHCVFINGNGAVGNIGTNGASTSYNTSSDYRLKNTVKPMTRALAKVAALKPVTYKWNIDNSDGEGFIAHELAEVVPQCVTGEKDATRMEQYEITPAVPATYDEEGNELTPAVEAVMGEREVPVYQGIDTSFLVATLTAAIQEQQTIIQTLTTRIEALEAK